MRESLPRACNPILSASLQTRPAAAGCAAAVIGGGLSSSAIPYVRDQLAMARLPRATFALLLALLPATASIIGIVVLRQVPSHGESVGIALVIAGVALHRAEARR